MDLPAQGSIVKLPASLAGSLGSARDHGFVVRTAWSDLVPIESHSYLQAVRQLYGTLLDWNNQPLVNQAEPGPYPGGYYYCDTINFETTGTAFDLTDAHTNVLARFAPQHFPGIPDLMYNVDTIAVEAVGFLELAAGTHTFGVCVAVLRTDQNYDDAYQVRVGLPPRCFQGLKVGEFERTLSGAVYFGRNENFFTVEAPVDGIYPFRLLYYQSGAEANLQWYSLDPPTGDRVLVNDPDDPRAIRAYRDSMLDSANAPYLVEISPLPQTMGNPAQIPIKAVLSDSLQRRIQDASVQLYLNNSLLTPQQVLRQDHLLSVEYLPATPYGTSNLTVRVEFQDDQPVAYTNTWSFEVDIGGQKPSQVTGQWDFDQGDLSATVGKPLLYFGGPQGLTQQKTRFGTTTELDLPDINGKPARIMAVPGDITCQIGYIMEHGISPNGGGTLVNQYTLIMDILIPEHGDTAASLLQISSTNNTDDGDLFWMYNNLGQGFGGYNGPGDFTTNEWHRVIAVYDEAGDPPMVTKYVDGIFQDSWTAFQGLDNPRRALQPTAILFGDGDEDERCPLWVNSIQIRSGLIDEAEAQALGGPRAEGIPIDNVVPGSYLRYEIRDGMLVLSWSPNLVSAELEYAEDLDAPYWLPVPGIENHSIAVPLTGHVRFYRLR